MASTASCMRAGMASSATRRRFSREPVISAVSSGASSVTRSRRFPRLQLRAMRCGGGGAASPSSCGRRRLGNDTVTGLPAWSPLASRTRRRAIDRELARLLDARALRVADVVQPRDELALADLLAGLQRQGTREDARHRAVALAVQARVDDARERHVVDSRRRRA